LMNGKLFVVEGADASGKHTQAELLLERLKKENIDAVSFAFPRYGLFFGKIVKKYLNGEFGSLDEVKPEFAALLYSVDRYDALPQIEKLLFEGKTIVCDRFSASNIAHQAAKFQGGEREKFIEWIETVESRLPKPSLTLFLDVPVPVSKNLMQNRKRKQDIHETNVDYLEATRQVYLSLTKKQGWTKIECTADGLIKPREEIHEAIWQKVQEYI